MIEINSSIEPLNFELFEQKQISVYIKRDDKIHPFISGNKWRKLKYTLSDAKQKNKNHLVSFGGAYSNHLNALACAGAMFGFKTTAFIRGDEGVSNQMLALNKLWGMEFIYTDRTSYRDKESLFEKYFGQNENAYFVNEGGAGVLGAKGCQEIVTELTENYQHIFCAVGTATTLQGIAQAIKNQQLATKAEGICVLKGAENIDEELQKNQLQDYYKIHHQFHEGGYAKSNPQIMDFITLFASKTGILLDQVYTAKMMMAVFNLAEQDYFEPNSKILCVHTGGILGLLGVLK
jgi:1-aminocyclopropane-1-carboxylate deaminase